MSVGVIRIAPTPDRQEQLTCYSKIWEISYDGGLIGESYVMNLPPSHQHVLSEPSEHGFAIAAIWVGHAALVLLAAGLILTAYRRSDPNSINWIGLGSWFASLILLGTGLVIRLVARREDGRRVGAATVAYAAFMLGMLSEIAGPVTNSSPSGTLLGEIGIAWMLVALVMFGRDAVSQS